MQLLYESTPQSSSGRALLSLYVAYDTPLAFLSRAPPLSSLRLESPALPDSDEVLDG